MSFSLHASLTFYLCLFPLLPFPLPPSLLIPNSSPFFSKYLCILLFLCLVLPPLPPTHTHTSLVPRLLFIASLFVFDSASLLHSASLFLISSLYPLLSLPVSVPVAPYFYPHCLPFSLSFPLMCAHAHLRHGVPVCSLGTKRRKRHGDAFFCKDMV